jgi:predicted  nucleic acid-binding Zn-ribbon protein
VDNETRQEFKALTALISGIAASLGEVKVDVAGLKQDVGALKQDVAGLKQDVAVLKQEVADLRVRVGGLELLVTNVTDSLIREIGEIKERGDRMNVKLDKIAAGAHYVTRLVEWSEKQDKFQEDILHRVQVIERRLDIRPKDQQQ